MIAHQFRDQLRDWVQGATVNAGNLICFRVGGDDSMDLAREFDSTPPIPDDEFRPQYDSWWPLKREISLDAWRIREARDPRATIKVAAEFDHPVRDADVEKCAKYLRLLADQFGSQEVADELRNIATRVDQGDKVTADDVKLMGDAYEEFTRSILDDVFVQRRVLYPDVPESESRSVNSDGGRSRSYRTESGPAYDKVPGRPRAYSDVTQQIGNELSHLPNFHARCKLLRRDTGPFERTFRTREWPAGSDTASRSSSERSKQIEDIVDAVRDRFTNKRLDVEQEFQKRYRTMLASIGSAWEPGEPLPPPEVRYDQEDD